MPPAATAPADADILLRPLAQPRGVETHAPMPAPRHAEALWVLLLSLLASLLGPPAPRARLPWRYPAIGPTLRMEAFDPDVASLPRAEEPRSIRRLRAWIGWILRCLPGLGMAPTGARPAPLRPLSVARAPPLLHGTAENPSRKPRPWRRRSMPAREARIFFF